MKIFDDAIVADYFAAICKRVTGRGVSRRIRSTGEHPPQPYRGVVPGMANRFVHISSVTSFSLLNQYTQKYLANLVEITIQKAGATTPRRNKLLAFH